MAKRIDTVTITIDAQAAREEMEKLKKRSDELGKAIAEMKKQLEDPGLQKTSAQWKQLNKQYKDAKQEQKELNNLIAEGEQSIKGMNDILSNLSKATYNDLIKQQRTLSRAIKSAKPNTKDYKELQTALRAVNSRVDELRKGWAAHDSQIVSVAKRLASYVAIYGGFNFIFGKIKSIVSESLKLSDAMADVQKTTGIAGEELSNLSKEIDKIDTRTTQLEMHNLAAVAGQIGLKETQDILGFVSASNQLTVALNELGQDGVQSLAKIAQLTGDIDRLGVEESLLAIGSSINELSANSAASAGPIADFMRRVGGVAPIANLATSDLAAMGATASALGQQMEVSGTALGRFILSVVNNTEGIAYALNMEEDSLRDLIETGQTMEAIIQVLEAVKTNANISGAALNDVFKEFGSEGQRMTTVVQALANNTSFLREQVELSNKAFDEATSATNEYNVKNENAAAIAQRIANAWQEFFVSADSTTWLTGLLDKILDLTKFLTGASNGLALFKSGLFSLVAVIVSIKLGLTGLVNSLGQLVLGIKLTDSAFLGHITTLRLAKKGTLEYRHAVLSLKKTIGAFMASNWVTIVLAGLTAIVTAVRNWNREIRELNEAKAELISQQNTEKRQLKELYDAAKDMNSTEEKRAGAIRKINEQYGDLLGYQLNEKASVDDLTLAYNLLNAEMGERLSNMIKDKMMEKATDEYIDTSKKAIANFVKDMGYIASTVKQTPEEFVGDVVSVLQEVAAAGKEFGSSDFYTLLYKSASKYEGVGKRIGVLVNKNSAQLRKLYNIELKYSKAQDAAIEAGNRAAKNAENKAANERAAAVDKMYTDLLNISKDKLDKMEKAELEALLNKGEIIRKYEKEQFEKRKAQIIKDNKDLGQDELNALLLKEMEPIKQLDSLLEPIQKAYSGDAWGKAFNLTGWKNFLDEKEKLTEANVDSLVATYKEMKEATARFSKVDDLNEVFGTNFTTIGDAQRFIAKQAKEIEAVLASMGRNTRGGFIKGSSAQQKAQSEWEQQQKDQYEAAKSALEAHYRKEEAIIAQSYINREITHEEMTRRISNNNAEMQRSFVDLYSVLLGEAKEYNTDFATLLPGRDLEQLGKNLQTFGPAMVDGMRNARENSGIKIREEAIKLREIIDKALLEGDMFGKLEDDFRSMLDELSLLTKKFGSEFIAVNENTAKKLVTQLTGMADKAYTMTREELKDEGKKSTDPELVEWWSGVSDEQLTLLLDKLQNYYDDRLAMQKRYADKMQREWQQYYKQTGGEAAYEAEKALLDQAKSRQDKIGGTSVSDYHQKLGIVRAEVDNEVKKIDNNMEFLGKKIEARKNEIVGDLMTIIEAEELVLLTLTEGTEEYENQKNLIESLKGKMRSVIAGDSELQALYGHQLDLQADRNAKMEEGEMALTDMMVEEWARRGQELGKWTGMLGEYLGEAYMLERQADEARNKAASESNEERKKLYEEQAEDLEKRAEQSKQNLIKNALSELVELGKVWATEYAMKLMYNSMNLSADTATAAASTGVAVTDASAKVVAGGYAAAGKEIASKGWVGLATGAAIIAAAIGLSAALKAAIANMFPEAVADVKDPSASAPKRKLTTGMLTYAEGKYPVLGNDGVVYDAEYAGSNMKTGVYRKPHFGIFAEKQPEMVIDGKTTQRLVLNYPEIYSGILELSRTGRMGMRTYATGNVLEIGEGYDVQAHQAQQQMQMEEMRQTMAATAAAVAALTAELRQGVKAKVDYFGKGGIQDSTKRGGAWAKKNRVG